MAPAHLSAHIASYDPATGWFSAPVAMAATVVDADGDATRVRWYSSIDGYLGTGESITARLRTIYDSSQPFITAKVTDANGATSEDTIQIIVWIPSDT